MSNGMAFLDHIYSEISSIQGENEQNTALEPKPGIKCPICKKILPHNANLSFHKMLHPWTEIPYSCDHCLYVSVSREELYEHVKEVHPSTRRFECLVCNKVFTNIRSLNKHKPVHALKLPFSCAYCDKGFAEYVTWRQHEVSHKSAKFQCEDCLVRFGSMKSYQEHCAKEPCKNKVLKCCEQVFATRTDYVQHNFEKHRFRKNDEYGCKFCGRLYAFMYQLNVHIRNCRLRDNKPNIIRKPRAKISKPRAKLNEGGVTATDADGENREVYTCTQCDRVFLTKTWLNQHQRRHMDPNLTKCLICNKQYASYAALYYHKQSTHLKIRRYQCSYCEKSFYSNQAMRDHLTRHTGEQPYACNFCPKRFKHRSSKTEHLRVHTGERPYHCSYCDMKFRRRDAKLKHERCHTGEKPYKCRICDRCFAQDSTWRSHEKKHSPPFACTFCQQLFTSKESLLSHKEIHSQVIEEHDFSNNYNNNNNENQTVEMATDPDRNFYIQYETA